MGNFIKATYYALKKTYEYLTPSLWESAPFEQNPLLANSDFLAAAAEGGSKGRSGGDRRERRERR